MFFPINSNIYSESADTLTQSNSWDTPYAIAQKFPTIMEKKKLGGTFAWGLGEDANAFVHFKALKAQMNLFEKVEKNGYEERATNLWTTLTLESKDEM